MSGASLTGRLLISKPSLPDPNFDGTITFLLEHGDDGALGVVINRPSELAIADAFPLWASSAPDPAVVFAGGPVERSSMIVLGASSTEDGPLPLGLHSVDLDEGTPPRTDGVDRIRVFAGYAGWGAGQLEEEIGRGAWWTAASSLDDVFVGEPPALWRAVMRREGGELRWFENYPADPSMN